MIEPHQGQRRSRGLTSRDAFWRPRTTGRFCSWSQSVHRIFKFAAVIISIRHQDTKSDELFHYIFEMFRNERGHYGNKSLKERRGRQRSCGAMMLNRPLHYFSIGHSALEMGPTERLTLSMAVPCTKAVQHRYAGRSSSSHVCPTSS